MLSKILEWLKVCIVLKQKKYIDVATRFTQVPDQSGPIGLDVVDVYRLVGGSNNQYGDLFHGAASLFR
jgi:hypothetical protein